MRDFCSFDVWVEALRAELLFYFIVVDRSFPEEPSLIQTRLFKKKHSYFTVVNWVLSIVTFRIKGN
jgi:hypothetical protein